jgi:2-keto-3-deoxy-L-rhamnonate aldolase RhmA
MEHGIFNNENLVSLLQACRLCGLPAFVRVPDHTNYHIARCLDLGADGIMIPRTESVAQVKAAVEAMRFPPIGHKGKGGYCQVRSGETLEDFNKNRHLLVQIESPVGIQALPEMLDLYGDEIAAIVIGPYDLSFTMGMPAEFDRPEFQSAVKEIFDICISRKKSVGIFCDGPVQAKKYIEMGANFLWMCTDDQIVKAGLRTMIQPIA